MVIKGGTMPTWKKTTLLIWGTTYPELKGQPLRPSEVVSTFARAVKRHGGTTMVADLVYIQSAIEHAEEHGIQVIAGPQGARTKLQTFASARRLFAEGAIEISREDDRLLRQLREVTASPTTGGGMSIGSPRRGGSHGDLASALVLALWMTTWSRTYDAEDEDGAGGVRIRIFGHDGTVEIEGDRAEPEQQAEPYVEPPPPSDLPPGTRLLRPEDF
jgi:hypothetical protein